MAVVTLTPQHAILPFVCVCVCFVTVLQCLQARYSARVFYTHAGCTLVALNPFQPIPHLYSVDVMREYHSASQPQVNIQSVHMYRIRIYSDILILMLENPDPLE